MRGTIRIVKKAAVVNMNIFWNEGINMERIFSAVLRKIDKSHIISAVRRGLIMVIPILMLGSMAQVLQSIPLRAYQNVLEILLDGAFRQMLNFIYDAAFGMLSVYIVFSITNCYLSSRGLSINYVFVGSLTGVASFFAVSGVSMDKISSGALGTKGTFSAIFCAIIVSKLYEHIINNVKIPFRLYADGVDLEFNDAIIAMIPLISITILFSMFNYFVCQIFHTESFQDFYVHIVNGIFAGRGSSFVNGFMYIVISGILCFFGIYGSNVLEVTSNNIFHSELIAELSDGAYTIAEKSKAILSKEFLNVFVMLGGYGTAFCLLISIVVFSRRNINKNLTRICAIPMVFNFSDLLSFGFPIIFNVYLLAPFLVVPVAAYCISFFAIYFGFVPMITRQTAPTVPIFISGYMATGSVRGTLLQVVVLLTGIFIYRPFVRAYDDSKNRNEAERMQELTDILKRAEKEKTDIEVLRIPGTPGALAKCLAVDIESGIDHEEVELHYQLQYDNEYNCIGAETLMRYIHPIHGFIYPPLVIKIADEAKILSKLERYLFVQAAKDYRKVKSITSKPYKISVNVTISTILEGDFIDFLRELKKKYNIADREMCIEITEQMAIKSDEQFEVALGAVKELGYMIAIDDFSMGSTSIKYLQNNQFDMVKLDGAIVKGIMSNERSKEIISSIVYLANSLNFTVLAEYVETEEQIEELKKIGCNYYQGYHFSKAVKIDDFLAVLKAEREGKSKLKAEYEGKLSVEKEQKKQVKIVK